MVAYILKSAVFLAVFLGAYYMLLAREKMYRFNRFYLLSGLIFSLVLPLITIPIYVEAEAQPFRQLPTETVKLVASMPVAQPEVQQTDYWPYAAIAVYLLIVTVLAIRFTINIARFYRVKKNNTVSEYKGATLVLLKKDVLPHTFMDTIFIGENEYRRRLIAPELLTHELAHVRQKHTLDVLFTELLKTIFWFNPLLYLYKKAIQTNHEFLADEAVIHQHLNIPTYQLLLLDKATPPLGYALASSINFSLTKKRFAMMTKSTTKGKKALLQAMMLPVITITTALLCHEVIAQQPETKVQPEPETITSLMPNRDEYYSGVRIIIEDKANGVSIDKKYEELTPAEKAKYMFDAPPKRTKQSPTAAQYEKMKDASKSAVWIDGVHVSNKVLNNYKPQDFSAFNGSFVYKNARSAAFPQEYQYVLFTNAYYEKHLAKYHYPANIYRMNVGKEYKDDKVIAGKEVAVENKVGKDGEYKWPPSDKIKAISVYKNSEAQNDSLKIARPDLFKIPGTKYARISITYEDDKGELRKTNLFVDQEESKHSEENGSLKIKAVSLAQPVKVKQVESQEPSVYSASEVDTQPEFPGGLNEFYKLIMKEFKIPDDKKDSVSRVYLSFVIEMDGTMSNFKILRSPSKEMGDEVIRVLKTITPKWKPGKVKGTDVRTLYSLPITINTKA